MKTLEKQTLSAKRKEQIIAVLGTVFIVVLSLGSIFSMETRNQNILTTLENTPKIIVKS